MPYSLLIAAALFAAPGAMLPDDPAVAACQMLVKQSLRVPESFARTAEPVLSGDTVTLAYTSRDAHGTTVAASQTCQFRLSARDGRFHLQALRRAQLEARARDARARLARAGAAGEALLIRSELLDISREMFVQDDRLKKAERLAMQAGIYPIAIGRTALSAR